MERIDIMLKMVLDRWNGALKNFNGHLDSLSDEQLKKQVAPGRNTGVYILGHMIGVHDDMLILLGMGDKLYPALHEPFVKQPDGAVSDVPAASELRAMWTKQCEVLNQKIAAVSADEWFSKHTAVSAEDFAGEPHRNKLNIIITRTTHLTYHTGQLVLIK